MREGRISGDLVVLDVRDGGGVVRVRLVVGCDEGGLVQANRRGDVESFAIGFEQGLAVGEDGVVDGVPVTVEFDGDLRDRAPLADLARGPLGGAGGE